MSNVHLGLQQANQRLGLPPPVLQNECTDCHRPFPVDTDELKWKFVCDNCFPSHQFRKCRECNGNIFDTAPKYAKECTDCWLKKKAKKYTTCPMCPKEKSTHLTRKKDQVACKKCLEDMARMPTLAEFESKAQRAAELVAGARKDLANITGVAEFENQARGAAFVGPSLYGATLRAEASARSQQPSARSLETKWPLQDPLNLLTPNPPSPKREREEEPKVEKTRKRVQYISTSMDETGIVHEMENVFESDQWMTVCGKKPGSTWTRQVCAEEGLKHMQLCEMCFER